MIGIIYDVNSLESTCYIEIFPDKYKGTCWNESSIFFTEENFGYILPVFEKCYKKFDYYSFNEIKIETWMVISKELEKVKQILYTNPNSLKNILGFLFTNSEKDFIDNYENNIQHLINMITEFQMWIKDKSISTKVISVLGI